MLQHECERGAGAGGGSPHRAIPQTDSEVAWFDITEDLLEEEDHEGQGVVCMGLFHRELIPVDGGRTLELPCPRNNMSKKASNCEVFPWITFTPGG